jgi:hypothetical protein
MQDYTPKAEAKTAINPRGVFIAGGFLALLVVPVMFMMGKKKPEATSQEPTPEAPEPEAQPPVEAPKQETADGLNYFPKSGDKWVDPDTGVTMRAQKVPSNEGRPQKKNLSAARKRLLQGNASNGGGKHGKRQDNVREESTSENSG